LNVYFPDGNALVFTRVTVNGANAEWVSWAYVPERIVQTGSQYVLERGNAWRYEFNKYGSGSTAYYQMDRFFDSQGNQYSLTYDAQSKLLTQVTEPAGRTLSITYTNLPVVDSKVISLHKVSNVPAGGQWTEVTVTRPESFRYVRWKSRDGVYGDIAEFEVYGTNQTVALSGSASAARAAASWRIVGFMQASGCWPQMHTDAGLDARAGGV
jgi:YD repeat-containing protein